MSSSSSSSSSEVVSFVEAGKVETSSRPVGLNWVKGGGEHLLVTSASQVILYSVHDGTRLREWSFRPSKPLSFSLAVRAASEQGLLVGLQGKQRLVAWPDKGSLTAAGAAGPEGMKSSDIVFPVSKVEVSASGVVWCVGEEEGQVACYSTQGSNTLALLASAAAASESEEAAATSSCLASPNKKVLLVLLEDGTLQFFQCPEEEKEENGKKAKKSTTTSAAATLLQTNHKLKEQEGILQASGMMWSHTRENTAYLWTVYSPASAGGALELHMTRVSFSLDGGREAAASLSVIDLYNKDLQKNTTAPTTSSSSTSKRRRASTSSTNTAANVAIDTLGLEAEGLLVTVLGGGEKDAEGSLMQAWDAEHGVVVGHAQAASITSRSAGGAMFHQSLLATAGEGVIAVAAPPSSSSSADVVVWRVETKDGPGAEGIGLRRALGKLSALPSTPSVFRFNGQGEWVCKENEDGEEEHTGAEDKVEELLALLRKTQAENETISKKNSKKRKRSTKGAFVRKSISARTALKVVDLCLSTEEGTAAAAAAGGKEKTTKRRKSGAGGSGSASAVPAERQAELWQLLQALVEAGKVPLRERPILLQELLDRGKEKMVEVVLAGPADLPERVVVQAVHRLLASKKQGGEQGGKEGEQEQEEQQKKEASSTMKFVTLAVQRPCCQAFLRAAMAELEGPTAALLLVVLRALLERALKRGAGMKPTEEQVLTWLEALLDANFVSMVLEGSRPAGGGGGVLRQTLVSVKEAARRAAEACEALELVDGYFVQFKRAGHAIEAIPDYSLDSIVI